MIITSAISTGDESASAHQISLKMDDSQLRYGDKTIFKTASVRHLEFMKFGILVTWPVSEHYSTSSYQILHQSDNISLRYSQKTIFNMAPVRHIDFCKILIFCHVTVVRRRICVCLPNVIENGWLSAEIWRLNHFRNGSRLPSWIFEIWHFGHVTYV